MYNVLAGLSVVKMFLVILNTSHFPFSKIKKISRNLSVEDLEKQYFSSSYGLIRKHLLDILRTIKLQLKRYNLNFASGPYKVLLEENAPKNPREETRINLKSNIVDFSNAFECRELCYYVRADSHESWEGGYPGVKFASVSVYRPFLYQTMHSIFCFNTVESF